MAKRKQKTQEELERELVDRNIKDMREALEKKIIPLNPTRRFEPGERVILGAHDEVYVRESHSDGLYYTCEAINVKRERDKPGRNEFFVQPWIELYKYGQNHEFSFTKEEKYRIRQLNSPVDSLLHMVYASHAGVDFDVEYQREHVWTTKDKVALIDSIFNNIDIGKIVLVQRPYTADIFYEVLDGKQRITAIRDFYEDRFKYKGFYYSELSRMDKYKFGNHGITLGYLENPNKEAIFESFIKLNTCGKPMAKKHIDHVKHLLKEYKEVKQQVSDKH